MADEDVKLPDVCPECGKETELGYGLTGGGIGPYVCCDCGFFAKDLRHTNEE